MLMYDDRDSPEVGGISDREDLPLTNASWFDVQGSIISALPAFEPNASSFSVWASWEISTNL